MKDLKFRGKDSEAVCRKTGAGSKIILLLFSCLLFFCACKKQEEKEKGVSPSDVVIRINDR